MTSELVQLLEEKNHHIEDIEHSNAQLQQKISVLEKVIAKSQEGDVKSRSILASLKKIIQ